jgi:uncharacterized protein (UPF0332 family)
MFDWLLYLNVADKMISLESEAGFRSAISRAYYGVFGKVRNRLETKGLSFNQDNVHQHVIEWLISQSDSNIKKIGWDLHYLRGERNRSDYNSKLCIDRQRAEKSLILARSLAQDVRITRFI